MIKIEKKNNDIWEVWQNGGLHHYGTLDSCAEYILLNLEQIETLANNKANFND